MITSNDKKCIVNEVCKKLKETTAKEILNVGDVATMLGKSCGAIHKMCQRRQLPFHKMRNLIFFDKHELINFLLDNSQKVC